MAEILEQIRLTAGVYGLPLTLGLVITIGVILCLVKYSPKIVKRFKDIADHYEDKKHKASMKARTNSIYTVNHVLTELREKLNGNMAYLFEYHNGGKNAQNLCFQHMTATHERNEVCEGSHSMQLNNLALSLFPDLLHDMSQTDILVVDIETARSKYQILADIIAQKHVKQMIFIQLCGVDAEIGFIIICRNTTNSLTDKDQNTILKETQKIVQLLRFD